MIKNHKKEEIRKEFKKLRSQIDSDTHELISIKVKAFIEDFLLTNNISKKYIGIYWPLFNEVDLRILKVNSKLSLALPSSNKDGTMNYHPWLKESLKKDFHGIPSPINERNLTCSEISILLLPAIAIDKHGQRLGYGGGYYDRLRDQKGWNDIPAIAVLPKLCISEIAFPQESWDVPVNGWITEEGFTKVK